MIVIGCEKFKPITEVLSFGKQVMDSNSEQHSKTLHQNSNEYFQQKQINEIMETVVTGLTYNRPDSPLTYIESCVSKIRDHRLENDKPLQWDMFIPTHIRLETQKKSDQKKLSLGQGRIGEFSRNRLNEQQKLVQEYKAKEDTRLIASTLPQTKGFRPATNLESGRNIRQGSQKVLPPIGSSGRSLTVTAKITKKSQGNEKKNGIAWDNIVFVLGGPGSGKGTQCVKLAEEFGYMHLSAGDLLRDEVKTGSEMGSMLDSMMKEGQIVPMEATLELLRNAMNKAPESANGFLIDGFPRQLDQAHIFEQEIAQCKFVLFFDCDESVLQKRLLKRGETSGRADDNLVTIKKRFETFIKQSYPVVEAYSAIGKCVKISSIPPPNEVYDAAKSYFVKPSSHGQAWENIVLVLGGPGCGKGTQCERLSKEFNYTHISSGDLLRADVATGSPRAQQLDSLMKEGKMVPVEITLALLREAMISSPKTAKGFLIDGFPRQVEQAKAFEAIIGPCKFALFFDCPAEELEKRLVKRGETSGRADDNLATIKKRFETFVNQSYPVVQVYTEVGKCVKISSIPAPDEVYQTARDYFIDSADRGEAWSNIVFVLGGPGCGKGTQCERLSKEFNYTHISSGDLLRAEVATGSPRAQQLHSLMKEGKMVPVEITLALLREAMINSPKTAKGFLIDGFPRQVEQAKAFEAIIGPCKFALFFDCPAEELEKRLVKRGETSGRADDNLATIKKRFETFVNQSYPVVQVYTEVGKCVKISSIPAPDQVYQAARDYFIKPADRGEAWNNIIFVLGGPGCGKGTQCDRISKDYNYTHISSGDLLRAEVATGSPRAQLLDSLMKEGKMVPVEITLALLREAMINSPNSARGFLIDGFPRQIEQAKAFEAVIGPCKFALFFDCPADELEKRLVKRGETSGRADDNLVTIKKRFETFVKQSYPVVESYSTIGKCISSIPTPNEVYDSVKDYFVDPADRGEAWNNIVFILGGPGCGKGTQCEKLAKEFNYAHISSGDLLRAEVATGSLRAHQLDALMKEGKMVPMEVTLALLREAMFNAPESAKGFLIDGFPRQMEQARAFEATIAPCKFAMYFECPEYVLQERLLKRGETSGRADDNMATIKKRFATFISASYPVVQEYAKSGKCVKISSVPPSQEVYQTAREYFVNQSARGEAWNNIVFVLGGPGSKGTQCERIARDFNYNHISAGDLLRAEVATGSERAQYLNTLMKDGLIVPMEITLALLFEAMLKSSVSANGFLIDGFPRQLDQARAFEATIAKCKFVLFFDCPEEVLVQRLLKRGETSGRADDNIETIKKRFATFISTSYPVVCEYEKVGKCVKISSVSSPEEVYQATALNFQSEYRPNSEQPNSTPNRTSRPVSQQITSQQERKPATTGSIHQSKPQSAAVIDKAHTPVQSSTSPVNPSTPLSVYQPTPQLTPNQKQASKMFEESAKSIPSSAAVQTHGESRPITAIIGTEQQSKPTTSKNSTPGSTGLGKQESKPSTAESAFGDVKENEQFQPIVKPDSVVGSKPASADKK